MQMSETRRKTVHEQAGLIEPITLTGMRWPGYPHLATDDIFVHEGSGRRFYIKSASSLTTIKGIPIVYGCDMVQAPFTDAAYTVPLWPTVDPIDPVDPGDDGSYALEPEETTTTEIFWQSGEWRVGVYGSGSFSYSTKNGLPDYASVATYSWSPVLGIERFGSGYKILTGSATGTYAPGVARNGVPAFIKTA